MEQPLDYQYKTKPRAHQHKTFMSTRDSVEWALLMEQGTGKTKVILDTAAYLYARGKIAALLVLAPNGVHRNWTQEELPKHLPDYCQPVCAEWSANMKSRERKALERMYEASVPGLRVFVMNIEAIITPKGKEAAKKFLQVFNTLLVVDESTIIKNPSAKRTKAAVALGKHARYRRILTGTPVSQGPLDFYAQFNFLSPDILGFPRYSVFKAHFAEWDERMTTAGQRYKVIKRYTNMDELQQLTSRYSTRILKADCLDLPPKQYTKVIVDLSPEQRRAYNALKHDLILQTEQGDIEVTHQLTLLSKLQQVVGGWLKTEDGGVVAIDDNNPRLRAFLEYVELNPGKYIVWARYRAEIAGIAERLRKEYGADSVVQYHGGVDNDGRDAAKYRFQHDPLCKFFIANKAAARGLTLHAAQYVFYYSNEFSLEVRLQSEDRAHRDGLKHVVTYIDAEARDTLDRKIIDALRQKQDISALLLRDPPRNWI